MKRSSFYHMFRDKLADTFRLVLQTFTLFPERFRRLGRHVVIGLSRRKGAGSVWPGKSMRPFIWWMNLMCYVLDLLAIPVVYEVTILWFKWNTRRLRPDEVELGREIFGDSLDFRLIWIDERARIACRRKRLVYVSFHTINSWGSIEPAILIHELTHIWQYVHQGATYIPMALLAQKSREGYNYGGMSALRKSIQDGTGLNAFNPEQQADIITDWYLLQRGLPPRWADPACVEWPVYEYFIRCIRSERI